MIKVNIFATKKSLSTLITLLFLQASFCTNAAQWPEGTSFVGLKNAEWQLHVVAKGENEPEYVETSSEPRTPTFHLRKGTVAYIAADGVLREQDIDKSESRAFIEANKEVGLYTACL